PHHQHHRGDRDGGRGDRDAGTVQVRVSRRERGRQDPGRVPLHRPQALYAGEGPPVRVRPGLSGSLPLTTSSGWTVLDVSRSRQAPVGRTGKLPYPPVIQPFTPISSRVRPTSV